MRMYADLNLSGDTRECQSFVIELKAYEQIQHQFQRGIEQYPESRAYSAYMHVPTRHHDNQFSSRFLAMRLDGVGAGHIVTLGNQVKLSTPTGQYTASPVNRRANGCLGQSRDWFVALPGIK